MESTFNHAESTKYIKALYHTLNAKISELKAEAVFEKFSFNFASRRAENLKELIDEINLNQWYEDIVKAEEEAKKTA